VVALPDALGMASQDMIRQVEDLGEALDLEMLKIHDDSVVAVHESPSPHAGYVAWRKAVPPQTLIAHFLTVHHDLLP